MTSKKTKFSNENEEISLTSFELIQGQKHISLKLKRGYDFIGFTRSNDSDLYFSLYKYNLSFCLQSALKGNHLIDYYFNEMDLKFQDLGEFGLIHLIFKYDSNITTHDIEIDYSENSSLLILDFLELLRGVILEDQGEFLLNLDHIKRIISDEIYRKNSCR